ncbi:MAG: transporter [Bryobacteraceae bacterium]|nr:transporter [Bryobacteraceae bacterium]
MPIRKHFFAVSLVVFATGGLAFGQATGACSASGKLGCMIPNLYGDEGFVLPNAFHRAHFLSDFQSNFRPFNGAIASELTRLPLASPASGFTYAFNSATGVFSRSAQSFGPILTERAETIGRGKLFLGFSYQRFSFDSIDGIDLDNIPVVFPHEHETGRLYESDFVSSRNSVDLKLNQFTVFGTVGLTGRFDVSVAVPILDLSMRAVSNATIHRIAPPDPAFGESHFFDPMDPTGSTTNTYTSSGSASGVGDMVVRLKTTVKRWESSGLAIATDVRFPTGDERNFLGAGTFGVKPFVAYSIRAGRVAPHVNVGYEINGSSVLSGDISTGRKGHLPNQLIYAAGADVGVNRVVTLAFDVLGQRVFNAGRIEETTFTSPQPELSNPAAGRQSYPNTRFTTGSLNINSAAAGVKLNLVGQLLATANVLFRLNDAGLKANVVPLIGLSYTF